MTDFNSDFAAQKAAQKLVTALHGRSVANAMAALEKLEIEVLTSSGPAYVGYHDLRRTIWDLTQGAALNAIRLARGIVFETTEVNSTAAGPCAIFAVWATEARLSGSRPA